MDNVTYDPVVVGSGPAGQKGAIAAAKLDKKVAVIDRNRKNRATTDRGEDSV